MMRLVFAALLVALGGYLLGSSFSFNNEQVQTGNAGEVEVTAKYLGDSKFEVALDTHSFDLSDYDFSKSIFLKSMNSELKTVSATPVTDSPPHHRIYLVTFPKFRLPATLVLNNLGNVSQTTLTFERR